MADAPNRSLNHFSTFSFTEAYWLKDKSFQANLKNEWLDATRNIARSVHHYQTYGLESTSDLLLWCAAAGDEPTCVNQLFSAFAEQLAPFRPYLQLKHSLWGLTRRSQYSKARSAGEIDPFQPERPHPYLIVYPFTKTAEWYLEDQETRQSMMNDHIRIGKQYRDVTQLLLYSFGLQDHEFVVVYETEDVSRFSQLVHELRGSEGRGYTKSDAPVHTAIYQPPGDPFPAW